MTNDRPALRTGGQLLVDALVGHGVDMAFGVPGESYLAVLDAFYAAQDRIKFVICRQEGGACFMAEGYAKATRRPGVCLVTRAPGAANAYATLIRRWRLRPHNLKLRTSRHAGVSVLPYPIRSTRRW